MTIYNIAGVLTGFFEAIMMFMLYETFCSKRENLPSWVYGIGIVVLTLMINLSNFIFNMGLLNIIYMILSCFVISFIYKGILQARIIISVLSYLIMGIIEILVLYGLTIIYGVSVSEITDNELYRLLGMIISKLLAFFVINIVHLKFQKSTTNFGKAYWTLLLIMFISITATVFLLFKLSYNIEESYMYNISIFCSFGLLFTTFLVIYLYEHLSKQAETIRNQEQYEQHLKTQLKHLDDILITQKQIKKFKHDFNNYAIGLKAYINDNDFQGANDYINELEKKFNHGEDIVETGNTALDAILSTKIAIAKSKGIAVSTKIQIPEKISVEPIDMCIIFGNALDNAIEACERAEAVDKKISVTIICKDKAVFCKIVNAAPKPLNSLIVTSKADKQNHGFGLENIKTALLKYNANPSIERTDTEFTLKFVIFTK